MMGTMRGLPGPLRPLPARGAVSVIANPWTPYGLGDDPFFQDPLAPTDDPTRPISLFVGRAAEVQLLGGQAVGSLSSRAVVQGGAGVGKTSVVNRL